MKRSFSIFCALALALAACESRGGRPAVEAPKPVVTDVTAQDYVMPQLPQARVLLTDAFGGSHAVEVEVASTRDQRTRGLMWRTQLVEGKGMFFIFPQDSRLSFWMKNTLIPLDLIFIRSDFTIVGIVQRAEPKTLTARAPEEDSMYVLEVPSGWSEKIGLRRGLKVQLQGMQGIKPEL